MYPTTSRVIPRDLARRVNGAGDRTSLASRVERGNGLRKTVGSESYQNYHRYCQYVQTRLGHKSTILLL